MHLNIATVLTAKLPGLACSRLNLERMLSLCYLTLFCFDVMHSCLNLLSKDEILFRPSIVCALSFEDIVVYVKMPAQFLLLEYVDICYGSADFVCALVKLV